MNNQQDSLEVMAISAIAFFLSMLLTLFTWF